MNCLTENFDKAIFFKGGHLRHLKSVLAISLLLAQLAGAAPSSSVRTPLPKSAPAPQTKDSVVETTQDKGYRFNRGGWIYVHLEGSPHDIGYQHGYLLAPEISEAFATVRLEATHNSGRDWEFFRRAAREMLWPKIDVEYQAELQGIVDGLNANKTKLDLDDIVALNAFQELPDYYVPWLDAQTQTSNRERPEIGGHCSAFVANGQLDEGPSDRDGSQQLDELHGWRALEHHVRHRSADRVSHADGRFSGRDRERRRFRRQFRRE